MPPLLLSGLLFTLMPKRAAGAAGARWCAGLHQGADHAVNPSSSSTWRSGGELAKGEWSPAALHCRRHPDELSRSKPPPRAADSIRASQARHFDWNIQPPPATKLAVKRAARTVGR